MYQTGLENIAPAKLHNRMYGIRPHQYNERTKKKQKNRSKAE
jgi:hypothetical protein